MNLSQFGQELHSRIRAGFQAMSVSTREPGRIRQELENYGRATNTPMLIWTAIDGGQLQVLHPLDDDDPLAVAADLALSAFEHPPSASELLLAQAADAKLDGMLVVYVDAHTEFDLFPAVRTVFATEFSLNRFSGRPCLFLHPSDRLHDDVSGLIDPIPLKPMSPADINAIAVESIRESLVAAGRDPGISEDPGDPLRIQLADACAGLSHHRIVDVLSLVHSRTDPALSRESLKGIRDYRTNIINASGLLTVHQGGETFADVGGLAALKEFLSSILRPRTGPVRAMPKGVMLHGVPGAGKSLIAKALGNETDRTTIELNIGSLLGGIVGESEANVRRALDIVDSSGPTILFLDEVEKALAGSSDGGRGDSGVMTRVFDALLRWLNDHESDVFMIATANNVSALPTEFTRAERFDAIYFVDVPLPEARKAIWASYLAKYGLDPKQKLPTDHGWTGAEIATACRLACLQGAPVVEAASSVVPVAKLNANQLAAMREWAEKHGARDADFGGPYDKKVRLGFADAPATRNRKLAADPERN